MSGDIQRPYPEPDDGDPPFGDGPSLERTVAMQWQTEEERQRLVAAGLWGPAEVAEFQRRQLEQRLCATWRASGLTLGKPVVLAADAYAVGAAVSLTGIADAALVEMCERYVRERGAETAPCGCGGTVEHHHFGCPVQAAKRAETATVAPVLKMPNCPRCTEDELGAIAMREDGPGVLCFRCSWSPEPAELPENVREAALLVLRREQACVDAARRGR